MTKIKKLLDRQYVLYEKNCVGCKHRYNKSNYCPVNCEIGKEFVQIGKEYLKERGAKW